MDTVDELMLTPSQVECMKHVLGLDSNIEPTLSALRKIVISFLDRVPFQNLTMITGPMRRPTWREICNAMLSGNGGLCTTRNPFLQVFLSHLGYDVSFVSASMNQPNCHIGLLVKLDDLHYWVDVGNGYPYMEPYQIDSESVVSHPFFDYRIRRLGPNYLVEHRHNHGAWKENQRFEAKPVPYSFFDEMHERHYTEVGWGPFLSGLRANRWTPENSYILRDRTASKMGVQTLIESDYELRAWLKDVFPSASFHCKETTTQAWTIFSVREQQGLN